MANKRSVEILGRIPGNRLKRQKAIEEYLQLLYIGCNGIRDRGHLIESFDLWSVYELAKNNGLSSLVAYALEQNGIKSELFKRTRDMIIAHHVQLGEAEKDIRGFLESKDISYSLLKGTVIKDLYPAFATREMGDIDILTEPGRRREVISGMEKMGFTINKHEPVDYNDAFERGHIIAEIHNALFSGGPTEAWRLLTANALERMTPGQNALSHEDQYIYIIAHAYRHHVLREIGLRFLLDIWFYRRAYPDVISSEYVRRMLDELDIADYEAESAALADELFTKGTHPEHLSESQRNDLEIYILSDPSGIFMGEILTDSERRTLSGKGWFSVYRYSLKALGEREKWYSFHSPFAYRHEWSRPFYLFGFSVATVLRKRSVMRREYGSVWRKR